MEQLENNATEFNQTVIEALDAVFASLESECFVNDGVAGMVQILDCYIEQVRCISDAASIAEMPGLHWVCALIERNLISLYKQNRLLTTEEFSLLSEWPVLLASYALNQGDCKIDELIWHLGAANWPAPLLEIDADELRHLLECDTSHCYCGSEQAEKRHGLFLVTANVANTPVLPATLDARIDVPVLAADAETEIHDVLDALIVMVAIDDGSGVEMASQMDFISRYAQQLQLLSSCAGNLSMDALASASDAFSLVLTQRAERINALTSAERALLNLFPMLAIDSVAAPEDVAIAAALLDLAFDPLWEGDGVMESLPPDMHSDEKMDACDEGNDGANTDDQLYLPRLYLDPRPGQMQAQTIGQDMLALLAKECKAMSQMLSEDLAAVLVPELTSDARSAALTNYADALARIGATAESLGLFALRDVFTHLYQLLGDLSVGLDEAQNSLLLQLPDKLLAYLAYPNDKEVCRGLIALLQAPVWAIPMSASIADSWVNALSQVTIIKEFDQVVKQNFTASASDVSLVLAEDVNLELLDGLLQELPLQVASFTSAIEKFISGNGSMNDVEQAKRAAHTLKGAANTVGVQGIANLTHQLEDLLIGLSEKNTLPESPLASLLMEAADCLEAMSEAVMGTGPAPLQALAVLQKVSDFACTGVISANQQSTPDSFKFENTSQTLAEVELAVGVLNVSETAQMLRVPAPVVDELLRLAGENVISNAQIQERLRQTQKQSKAIQKQDALFQKLISELENLVDVRGLALPRPATIADGDFDPLEFERYSELHTITSQLIEARTDAAEMSGKIDDELDALAELLEVQRRLQMENQHAVIRTRLVPVSTLVSRLQRSVRQTSRLLDKQLELKITGESTSVDSNMLHDLIDPLMHVLRNAVDHGIEPVSERLSANKSAFGLIELSFAREANAIVVRCKDDGAGLDYAAIRRIAVQKNMISLDLKQSDEELARLILMPGFSTRDVATQTSGRGIGMDVVYSSILEMKGSLSLVSHVGCGLTVELRLPATLLSEHTLMARIGGKLIALSSRRILDIHYITPDQIDFIGQQQIYRLGDTVYKLLKLVSLLDLPFNHNESKQLGYPVLLVSTDSGETCAVLVPELIDGREVVVKKLGPYVPKIPGTIGAVILGDGSVAPVIDLPELLRACSQTKQIFINTMTDSPLHQPTSDASRLSRHTALIVDDSLSARRAAAQIMRDAGYEVHTAIDGLDAVALLEHLVPDVILLDMEMPRMNGLELSKHVRGRAHLKDTPIIMITSRSTEKHRQQGDAAGINAYLIKPFSADKLLQYIDSFLGVMA